MIIQNAVSHEEGLSPLWAVRRAFWQDRAAHEAEVRANLLSLEATRNRHIGTSPDSSQYNPDLWVDEYYFLNQPGQADIQLDLFYDYQNNVKSYPKWQQWLRDHQPPLLVLWVATTPHSPSPAAKRIAETIRTPKCIYSMRGTLRWI